MLIICHQTQTLNIDYLLTMLLFIALQKLFNHADGLEQAKNVDKKWQRKFNVSKCSYLQIGAKITFNVIKLKKKVDFHAYLEVCLRSKIKWDRHIHRITSAATQ